MSPTDPAPWLLLVAAVHLGFQLTVSLVVYPALRDVGRDDWARAHAGHSRRITPLVGLLYLPLVIVVVWAAVAKPGPATWAAAAGAAASVLTTALVAAPVHGRLGDPGPDERPELHRRLARADAVRTAGALVCVLGALWLLA